MHDADARRVIARARRDIRVMIETEVVTHLMSHCGADPRRLRADVLYSYDAGPTNIFITLPMRLLQLGFDFCSTVIRLLTRS